MLANDERSHFTPSNAADSENPCFVGNGGCSHICLLSASENASLSCVCPTGLKLDGDNGTDCLNGKEVLVVHDKASEWLPIILMSFC